VMESEVFVDKAMRSGADKEIFVLVPATLERLPCDDTLLVHDVVVVGDMKLAGRRLE
jgi:hypothetical protein